MTSEIPGLKDTVEALVQSMATQGKLARLEEILQSQLLLSFLKGLNFEESVFGRSPDQSISNFMADI